MCFIEASGHSVIVPRSLLTHSPPSPMIYGQRDSPSDRKSLYFPDGAPIDSRSSRVKLLTVIHLGMCGHLDSLVLSENNARRCVCGGG